jgi:hypothetical protein
MRKMGLATMLFLVTATAVAAQGQCQCLSTPFTPDPPCFNQCAVNLLETASLAQLQTMLGMSRDTAAKIVSRRNRGGVRSLEAYREVLAPEEFRVLGARINSLSSYELREFGNFRRHEVTGAAPVVDDSSSVGRTSAVESPPQSTAAAPGIGPTPTASPGNPSVRPASPMRTRPGSVGAEKRAPGNTTVEAIKKLETERNKALVAGDLATLDRLYSDDYTAAVGSTFRTKPEVFADLKSGVLKLESSSNDETNVRVYGNTAVVTGKSTSKVHDRGGDTEGQAYFTRVWVNQKGNWRLVANHSSRITQ